MSHEFWERFFNRRRWTDLLTAKSAVMWLLIITGEATAFDHERLMGVGWCLTCLTTTAMVLLRIDGSNDAWRRGYKQAVVDVRGHDERPAVRSVPFRG